MKLQSNALTVESDVILHHLGPSFECGPLPSLFYFAISGPDTLCLDPYNQIVQVLSEKMIRIFSMTLPGHEPPLLPSGAMELWAKDLSEGKNCVEKFLNAIQISVDFGIKKNLIDPGKLGCSGLSRGAFIASHLASRDTRFGHLLLFSPLTRLSEIKEFENITDLSLANTLDLVHLAPRLSDRRVQMFIGNNDTRVGTRNCFEYAMELVKHKKTKKGEVELHIYPSIGLKGHGTPPEIFQKGAQWVESNLILGIGP